MSSAPALQQRSTASYDALTTLAEPLLVPLSTRRYNMQYSSLYDFRLRRLKHPDGRLLAAATRRWTEGHYDEEDGVGEVESQDAMNGAATTTKEESQNSTGSIAGRKRGRREEPLPKAGYVKRILDVRQGKICFVIGTIYCSMHLKPDVLEELTREQWLPPQPPSERYADPERDEYFIEDESGRVRLVGAPLAPDGYLRSALVTGVVVAVLGTETSAGDFEVADALFAGVPPPADESAAMDVDNDEASSSWVAIVSGLDIEPARLQTTTVGKTAEASSAATNGKAAQRDHILGFAEAELRLMMLTDWLLGAAGDEGTSSRIVSLVVAGNSVAPAPALAADRAIPTRNGPGSGPLGPPGPKNAYPTSSLDDFLADLSSTMHVHLLPGASDPTSQSLPQQPLHYALLPKSSQSSGLHRETNPAWFGAAGKRFLGTSGQNIDDIFKYMVAPVDGRNARLEAASHTLDWAHLAPTAPDTLACYPLNDRDPFLIEEAPDVYFVGNQDCFATRLYRTKQGRPIRIVLVPRFSTTGSVVLVNPATLACKLINIGGPVLDEVGDTE